MLLAVGTTSFGTFLGDLTWRAGKFVVKQVGHLVGYYPPQQPQFLLSQTEHTTNPITERSNATSDQDPFLYLSPAQTDFDIARLPSLTHLKTLVLYERDDIQNSHILPLTNLERLVLRKNSSVNVDCLTGLPNLKELTLSENVTIRNNDISLLTNLEALTLSNNAVINGLWISDLPKLWYLDISGENSITLNSISRLTNLSYLVITGNDSITSEDAQAVFPECNIEKRY